MNRTTPRIQLLGADGQVGRELRETLAALGDVVPATREDADLRDAAALRRLVERASPAAIVNAAAWTDVDAAETDRASAAAVNVEAPRTLAELCRERDALLVHFSTDYVFDGAASRPYSESDAPRPLNVYGTTKLEGERAIETSGCRAIILRTSWVYGLRGRNFLRTVIRLATDGADLRIVADQTGAPTWSRALAEGTADILARVATAEGFRPAPEQLGTFHLTAAGATTWYGFARAILERWPDAALRERRVVPIASDEFPRPARRPAYSVLDNTRVAERFGVRLAHWREQLARALAAAGPDSHSAAALHEP